MAPPRNPVPPRPAHLRFAYFDYFDCFPGRAGGRGGGALAALAQVLDSFAHGEGVTVVPTHAELTTQQATDALHVSRPLLIGLLDAGQIEYRMVGTHRRVESASLIRYLREDEARRHAAADALAAQTRELGLANRPDALVGIIGIVAAITVAWGDGTDPGDVLDSLAIDAPTTVALIRQT